KEKFLPRKHGFDLYYGIPYSNDMTIAQDMKLADDIVLRGGMTRQTMWKAKKNLVPLMRNEEVIEYPCDQATLTKRYTEQAIGFMRENRDRPFFIYLPHTMPHIPLFASKAFKGKSKRGLYGDVIEEIDWGVGEILRALKELGLDENTLVVFTSDNGPWLSKGKNGGSALPLRSGKFTTFEGGMREPCIMRWPGKVPAGTECREVAATIDLLPTLASLGGAKLPADRAIDGRDIFPLIRGEAGAKSPHEGYYFYKGTKLEAVRSGKWKLRTGRGRRKRGAPPTAGFELYDLDADIGEKNNVAGANQQVVARLKAMMQEFDRELKANSRRAGKT
ncbi:MAG: sulfatase-like hydrolase/transferase, partial [Planctomycetota bacterium]